ncbi:MAG TPA: phosphotransferase, partial [Halioglobus sp.]
MQVVNSAKVAWVVAREGGRLVGDALGDLTGTSVPFKAQDVVHPEILSRLINTGTLQPGSKPVTISAVRRQAIPSVSSNCHNLVLSIEQAGEPTLPTSLFVKLPLESRATRWFFSIINAWRVESHFFRHVARELPLRTPVTFATRCQGTRFYLVQENLHDDPRVELFTNPDMLAGPSLAQARRCLDTLARLHASHYGLGAPERERILPLAFHPFLSPSMGMVSRRLNRHALKPCMKKCPGVIPADVVRSYQLSVNNWDALLEYWFSGPLSLLHGDSHLGNFFACGDEMGMLDWQATHWGKGIRDVQYFLIDSLPSATLAAHEQELVDYYVQRRAHYGAAIDAAAAWQDYRSF